MKKLICMILAVALLIPLAACGGSGSSEIGTYYFSELRFVDGNYTETITKQDLLSHADEFEGNEREMLLWAYTRLEIHGNGNATLLSSMEPDASEDLNYTDGTITIFVDGKDIPASFSLKNGVVSIRNYIDSSRYEELIFRKK